MEDDRQDLINKIQELSDLELACLICLVADQRCCIIETDSEDLSVLEQQVAKVCQRTYQLESVAVHCNVDTTCDIFSQAILVRDEAKKSLEVEDYVSSRLSSNDKGKNKSARPGVEQSEGHIANVIIISGLNYAPESVQIQALELIRGRRTFSRKAVHVAPQQFLVISLQQRGQQRLFPLLNDQMFMCHDHDSEADGNVVSDSESEMISEADSMASVIHSPPATPGDMTKRFTNDGKPFISLDDIKHLQAQTRAVAMSSDIKAYLHDMTIYLRNHRAVAGGASAIATQQLHALSRVLAPLHSLTFITPSLVALAARKIYPHRLTLVAPEQERSLQWGSSLEAVTEYLRDLTIEDVIEQVIESVETPL